MIRALALLNNSLPMQLKAASQTRHNVPHSVRYHSIGSARSPDVTALA
ncbi:hypothetical protein SAMN05216236_1258 [Sedimentitalea nanhaiensis]|uniref:Uncharacterized protein n=1 Tax=Sedimentitalea nanhaiensis TaxID=999627 RepID=A0A1I7D9R6_9RHOB|nr:hypothetical protein SAMN05216236_1258 [Sedimentitalea nanhaiensis]